MDTYTCNDRVPWGRDLRYVLTWTLLDAATTLSIRELVRRVEDAGFVVPGRASKTVADALRWEIARGRVVRVGRGLYRPGVVPRQTKSRIRRRVAALRSAMAAPALHVVAETRDATPTAP
jgi:hypothetical protein